MKGGKRGDDKKTVLLKKQKQNKKSKPEIKDLRMRRNIECGKTEIKKEKGDINGKVSRK